MDSINYYKLFILLNRTTNINDYNLKTFIEFHEDASTRNVWSGDESMFYFKNTNNLASDFSILKSEAKLFNLNFKFSTTPYMILTCNSNYYNYSFKCNLDLFLNKDVEF